MKPGDDITSVALSLRLKELHFPQSATLCYAYYDHSEAYVSTTIAPVHPGEVFLCAAYTQSDLAAYLPGSITYEGKLYLLETAKTTDEEFYIGYRQKDGDLLLFRFNGFSADTYARLAIALIEEGKIASPILEPTNT